MNQFAECIIKGDFLSLADSPEDFYSIYEAHKWHAAPDLLSFIEEVEPSKIHQHSEPFIASCLMLADMKVTGLFIPCLNILKKVDLEGCSYLQFAVLEIFHKVLASSIGNNLDHIIELVSNSDNKEDLRSLGIDALLSLVAEKQITKEKVLRLYQSWLKNGDSELKCMLIQSSLQLNAFEIIKEIEHALIVPAVRKNVIGHIEILEVLSNSNKSLLHNLHPSHYGYIKGITETLKYWWPDYQESYEEIHGEYEY